MECQHDKQWDAGSALSRLSNLRFDGALEARFQEHNAELHAKQSSLYIVYGLLVFMLFGVADVLLLNNHMWQVLQIRSGIALLYLLILVFLSRSGLPRDLHFHMRVETLGLLMINAALVYIGMLAARDGVPEYQSGTLLVILFATTLSRLTFRYCTVTIILSMLSYSLLLLVSEDRVAANITVNNLAVFLASALFAMINAYHREYETRRDFLTTRMLQQQHQQLQQSQIELTWLVERDSLTGLFNRRYFDQQFASHCAATRQNGAVLSLLYIDVDYFKRFNDGFGHLAGDECLRQIATVINRFARRQGDVAARIGGEEFALLLPGMSMIDSVALGQQLLQEVQQLAIEHPDGGVMSVSCGLCASDIAVAYDPDMLRGHADTALYQAKHAGRNCLVSWQAPLMREA
ncbi:MAG: diguanylate cyclase domain-containing protein, partial [Plesiomonas sp.]